MEYLSKTPWGYNGHYNNPEYKEKMRIAQHKRYGTLNKLNLPKIKMNQQEYLHSDKNILLKKIWYGGRNNKGNKRPDLILKNKDPTFKKLRLRALINHQPNKPERMMIELFNKYNLPYKYVGDRKIWIEGRNPDFININGQKKVIEMFGEWWHSPLLNPKVKWNQTLNSTRNHYKKYGFKSLIIWQSELSNPNKVLEKIINFEHGD